MFRNLNPYVFAAVRYLSSANTIKDIISNSPCKVVAFIKGTKDAPKCGFSNAVVKILEMHGVDFQDVDVLADEDVRKGVKEYSNWPTIPQIYINKEFVGGCDILLQMHKNGELIEELKKLGSHQNLKHDTD